MWVSETGSCQFGVKISALTLSQRELQVRPIEGLCKA